MKKIEAYIHQEMIEYIRNKLKEAFKEEIDKKQRREGYPGITIYNVEGKGAEYSAKRSWGGKDFEVSIFPRTKIEIIVVDEDLEKTIDAIVSGVKEGTEKSGRVEPQGKIFVYNVELAVRMRDGKRGDDVIK